MKPFVFWTICPKKSLPYLNHQVGTFLYRKLGRLGLALHLQTFTTSPGGVGRACPQMSLRLQESGVNLVGVLPGRAWGSPGDRPMVVTASWHLGPPASR